jgi:hypothetical protein
MSRSMSWSTRAVRRTASVLVAVLVVAAAGASADAQTVTFAAPAAFATGSGPSAVASADFNGDGIPDLVVVNGNDDTISILLGDGAGGFVAGNTYATPSSPFGVAIADLNRDGIPDIVLINCSCVAALSVLLGNGDGTFAARVDYALADEPYGLVIADFNRDGLLDLAITSDVSDVVSILIGNLAAPGTFLAPVNYPTGSSPEAITAGDFNGDGIVDLAVVNAGSDTVSIFLGVGDGTFAAKVDYATDVVPEHVVVGDFNRDGVPDLAVASQTAESVSVLLGNAAVRGTFLAHVDYNVGITVYGLGVADVNGDGKLDLAVTNGDAPGLVFVLTGNGDGTFNASFGFAAGDSPLGLSIADLDGDGRLDVVVTDLFDDTVSVLLNTTPLRAGGLAFARSDVTMGAGPRSVAVGDFNRDGIPDVVTAGILLGVGSVTVRLGNGDETFGSPTSLAGVLAGPAGVAVGDVNGDGIPDVLWTDSSGGTAQLSVALGNGDGTFQSPIATTLTGAGHPQLALSDVNRDGILDVVLANTGAGSMSVLLGNGDGTFSRTDYRAGTQPWTVAISDLDGDGAPDIVVTNAASNSVSVFINTGTGTFGPALSYAMGATPRGLAVGDVNRDGIPDVVTVNVGSVSVRLGVGDGTLAARTDMSNPWTANQAVLADVNRDGHLDLVAGGVSGTVSVWLGNGDGTFAAPAAHPIASGAVTVAVADMDRDGRPDIVTANSATGKTSVLLARAAGFKFSAALYTVTEKVGSATITVLRVGDTSTSMSVRYETGTGTMTAGTDYMPTSGQLTFGVGETLKTFGVTIIDDDITEAAETLPLILSEPGGDSGLAVPSTATLKVTANDTPAIRFSSTMYSVSEDAGSATITVTRTAGAAATVTVHYATSNGTAIAGQDYTAVSGTLTFGPNVMSRNFAVPILQDTITEGAETINLTLSNAGGGAVVATPSTAVLTIKPSD